MKRVISCDKCRWNPTPCHPGEWFKRIHGTAKKDMQCDWCGKDIKKDTKCAAESMGPDRVPYFPWETEFINE